MRRLTSSAAATIRAQVAAGSARQSPGGCAPGGLSVPSRPAGLLGTARPLRLHMSIPGMPITLR